LSDQGRLIPAIETWEDACRLTKIPDRRALATYNIGATYFHKIGDGVAARRQFLAAIEGFESPRHGQHPQVQAIYANALENTMLCALSFDEFEDLAARLHAIAPGVPILTGLVPEVRQARERGEPWSDRLFAFAGTYYNRNDPSRDIGRYGQAKSTYHLLLAHRRDLRLSREDRRLAMHEYCVLAIRMAVDCMKVRGGDNDVNSPEEFLPILTEALPLVDGYLADNPGDNTAKKLCRDMEQVVVHARQRWAVFSRKRSTVPTQGDYQVCQKCGSVFVRRGIDGPELVTGVMHIRNHPTVCSECGGKLVWQCGSETEESQWPGCFPAVLLFGILAAVTVVIVLLQ
jgi:hypothetical protein